MARMLRVLGSALLLATASMSAVAITTVPAAAGAPVCHRIGDQYVLRLVTPDGLSGISATAIRGREIPSRDEAA